MAHFAFEAAVNEAVRMDAPLRRGPPPRWQRKNASASFNTSKSGEQENVGSKQTSKAHGDSKTPLKGRSTPGNTPTTGVNGAKSKLNKSGSRTPGRKGSKKTPTTPLEDRFIPNRSTTDQELSHYLLVTSSENENTSSQSPSKAEFQKRMAENLNDGHVDDAKVLSFKAKAQPVKDGSASNLRVIYSSKKNIKKNSTSTRHISQTSERILDAPELINDYYLNLLDWSANNYLAVSLGGAVYLWNAFDGSISQLLEMEGDDYVSCVSWIKEGNILAVGNSSGSVQLWDVEHSKIIRTMTGHAARVGALSWNSYILSSGSRTGAIHHHDVRVAEHNVGTLLHHTLEVCGLKWSPDGKCLASGGNDNLVNLWEFGNDQPVHTLTQHVSAVKALAWCPWQSSLLASGGGTADRCIRFWNSHSGACLNTVDTGSQVCSILWSKEYKELISGHGYSQNQLIIWKYPVMSKVTELTGHQERVLCLCMSPDGQIVASAAADETVRLWKCFTVDQSAKKSASSSRPKPISMMNRGIR